MISRRQTLAAVVSLGVEACRRRGPAAPASPPADEPLRLDPLVDLVAAAGLRWLVRVRPAPLLADAALSHAIFTLVPERQMAAFAESHGGVDLRRASEIVVAGYPETMLSMARVPVDPRGVMRSFADHALAVEGHAVDHDVVRTWGTLGDARAQVATFGTGAVALERGRLGILRVAEYFALGRLKRATPALRAEPLAHAVERLANAPAQWLAPGPFDAEWSSGLDGLLRVATSVAVGLSPGEAGDAIVRLVASGPWGDHANEAARHVQAALDSIDRDPLGHLIGLGPTRASQVSVDTTSVTLDVPMDAERCARALHAVVEGTVAEIMTL